MSYGSLMEVYCQLQIANDLGYISIEQLNDININIEKLAKLLSGLRNYITNRQNSKS